MLPATKLQKELMSYIANIILSWRETNDMSSPTMQSDIMEELRKVQMDYELSDEYINWLELKISDILYIINRSDSDGQTTVDIVSNHPGLLSEIQAYLRSERICVYVIPVDSRDSWSYRILLEDIMAPFFEPDYDKENEFPTYEHALRNGLIIGMKMLHNDRD